MQSVHHPDLAPASRRPAAARRPAVVLLDAIETLASLDPVADVLEHAGLPDEVLELFFGRVLRDAFALELAGRFRPFGDVAQGALEATLAALLHPRDDVLVRRVIALFEDLPPRADVRSAIERLRGEGIRVVLHTNASRRAAEAILRRGGLDPLVEGIVSSDDSRHYKPAREAYLHAARALETVPSHVVVVAAHSWDVQGAKQAGMGAAWVRRHELAPNPIMTAPDYRGDDLVAIAETLASLPVRAGP